MNEESWRRIISGERMDVPARIARPLLKVASYPYLAGAFLHRWAYGKMLRPREASLPVISIGNLTVGGTGKTPLVQWLVGLLREEGALPAVLTRGYRGEAGFADEPAMLRASTAAMVIVNPHRWAGAKKAAAEGADVCVLDDGFQHVRLARDLEIVAVDATCPLGYGHMLPRGLLREPISALRRADAIVLTRCDQVTAAELRTISGKLRVLASRALLAESVLAPSGFRGPDGQLRPVQELAGRKVWAFCGLGNPAAFYRTLAGLGAEVAGHTTFNDHHAYTQADIDALGAHCEAAGASGLVTTSKDAIKLPRWLDRTNIGSLEVELKITAGESALKERISQVLSAHGL